LMAESTKMSSQVPIITPRAENSEMSPDDRLRRWAQKYLRAMKVSKDMGGRKVIEAEEETFVLD
jgi:hypothetical protein